MDIKTDIKPNEGMMRNVFPMVAAYLIVFVLSGCANLDSISRSTQLGHDETARQTAVHLDVKQRVLLAKDTSRSSDRFMTICAEPSPDALSAYAQATGLGLSLPKQGSFSGSNASQESAGSIGLRTQSITLMRDSLYRVCEAYYNQAINGPQVLQLLTHAEDVTVAILAIEQLTGAVAPQQISLGGTSNSTASAQASYYQALVDSATENLTSRNKELADATTRKDTAIIARDNAKVAVDNEGDATKKASLITVLEQKQAELTTAEASATTAKVRADDAAKVKEQIIKNPSAALSSTSATASSTRSFGNTLTSVKLDSASTSAIATAVENIVKTVTQKNYLLESCMAFITRNWSAEDAQIPANKNTLDLCRAMISTGSQWPGQAHSTAAK